MYTEEQQILLQKFEALSAKPNSQNKACNLVGVSAAIMTQLRAEKYTGNPEAQFDKLASYFSTKEEAAAQPSSGMAVMEYVPTSISKAVYSGIRNCQLQGGLADICGKAGIGKTMACKRFVQDHPNDSIYIALNPCITTIRSILRILCMRLNVSDKTIDEMWFGVAAKLRDGMVIIIDEKQHCPLRTLEALRAFSDYFTEQGQTLGIALVGNAEKITSFGASKKVELDQINNRTKNTLDLDTSDIKLEDMRLLFPYLVDHDKTLELEYLLLVARSANAVRGAVNLYNNAINNGDASHHGLAAMAKHMRLRV